MYQVRYNRYKDIYLLKNYFCVIIKFTLRGSVRDYLLVVIYLGLKNVRWAVAHLGVLYI